MKMRMHGYEPSELALKAEKQFLTDHSNSLPGNLLREEIEKM